MKKLLELSSFTLFALAFLLLFKTAPEVDATQAPRVLKDVPSTLPSAPLVLQPIRQIVPPPTQSTLLEDTERETDLRVSLENDKAIGSLALIQSVNCEAARCQILVEKLSEGENPIGVFSAHLQQHPEFGKTLLLSANTDKENKKLVTFVFSHANQMSSLR